MQKYKLSSYISISDVKEEFDEDLQSKYSESFILYNEANDKEFLINATVKYFIDKFSPPATEEEVVQLIKQDVQATDIHLENTCSEFFKFLSKKKILVPADQEEPPLTEDTLFKDGDHLENYSIDDVLADKHYLDIYIATDTTTTEKVVIKLLNKKKVCDHNLFNEELLHLEREYSLLESIKHLTVINKTKNFKKDRDEYAYIALEYIEGKNLSRFFKELPTLTKDDCLLLIKKILEAFSLLHQCNLIHGDIHPSNIMVGEDYNIMIIDLGLSRPVKIEKNEILKHGGVTFYMPPERINISSKRKYSREPDLYSDVYQLGLVMYRILYDITPFDGFIWEELAQNIKEQSITYPELSFHGFKVSPALQNIIDKCTAKQPNDRYPDATAILDDVKEHILKEQEQFVN